MSASTASQSSFTASHQPQVSLSLDSPALAETYDRVGHRQYDHGKLLVEDLGIHPGHKVLDVGCGTGLLTAYVADLVGPGGQVVGIDPLPDRLAIARRRARPNVSLHIGSAEDLAVVGDQRFDVVYLNSVFHWLSDQPRVLREVRRVLAPGGRVGITTAAKKQAHDIEEILRRVYARVGSDERRASHGTPHKVSSGELKALLEDAGLDAAALRIRTFTDTFADVDEVLAFLRSSSFGNHASDRLTDAERAATREALAAELDRRRREGAIMLKRHLIFTVAERSAG
jgi:arsenite methyltransferase